MTSKIALALPALLLIVAVGFELGPVPAYANKVDCTKVMTEVGAGKKTKDIAKDLSISTSSVYRCKSKAKAKNAGAKTTAAASPTASASPATHK